MPHPREPLVYLVGAGPGHPGLLTLRAVEVLGRADVVLHDKLVPLRLLEHAPATAERICVTDLPGCHPERWPHIHEVMIARARQGQVVVRLKGGDPFIFGRGGEEAEALTQAGIPFECVPGVTAALAAAACAGIPLTHRSHASALAIITGHENLAKPDSSLDWEALARFPGTLAIYMGISRLAQITQALLEHGKDPATPAAVVHRASTGEQVTVDATLADLPRLVQGSGVSAPSIILIGSVVGLRPALSWFERRPLFGKRVVVTRPERQAGDLVHRFEELGAIVYGLPAVTIREPADWGPVDRALARLAEFDWLVFTSANGVEYFLRRLRRTGRDLRALGGVKLAAIGPGTADALRAAHLEPDLVPAVYRSEELANALKEHAAGQRILLARADRGRDLLRQELDGVAQVEQVAVYSQADAIDAESDVLDCLRRGEIDVVTFTSSNIAQAVLRALDETSRARILRGEVRLVSISPVTSAKITELGFPVAAEAKVYTAAGLLDAVIELAGQVAVSG